MGIFERFFGKGKKKVSPTAAGSRPQVQPGPAATPRPPVQTAPAASPSLIDQMEHFSGIADLFGLLRDHSASEIEQVCREFPIESLCLDYGSVTRDFRNSQRFELITYLAQILVRYKETREENPDSHLPESLAAKELAEILMVRLMPFIKGLQGMELAQSLKVRLYDFAMGLLRANRHQEALICLLASRPSIKDDHEFWICASAYNIANTTKRPEDIAAAVEYAEGIVSGKVKVPEKYMSGARKMFDDLKK